MADRDTISPPREVVLHQPEQSFRWAQHDYPSHLSKWHCHPEYELHLITASSGTMMVGDHIGRFEPGNLILTGPYLPHNWLSHLEGDEQVRGRDVLIQFTPEFADQLLDSFPEVESCRKLFRMASYGMAFSGQTAESGAQMLHQIGETSGINRLIAFLDLLQVLTKTESEQTILSQIAPALGVHSPHSRRLEGLVAFIDSHFRDNISLGDAARRLNMEDSTFSRFFKKHTGHGFVDYLNHLRVHHACTLLTRTSLPVTAVCFESGFNNTANFNKQFLRICRETPKEYRKRTRSFLQNELQTGIFNAEGQL